MKIDHAFRLFTLSALILLYLSLNGSLLSQISQVKDAQLASGEFTAQINGLKLWYKVSGSGPVCIHPTPGWGPSSDMYFLTLKPLEKIFTMVYLDTRGCGRSERPDSNAYAMKNFVDDLEGLRKHLGVETVWLMGHSDGGPMILNYTFEYPHRVDGLILADAPVGNTSQNNERIERMQLRRNEPWFDSAFKAFRTMPTTQKEFETMIQTILPFFFSSIENLEKNRWVFEKTTVSFAAQRGRGISDQTSADLDTFLPATKIPAFIVAGSDDFICSPASSRRLHDEIPGSALLIINKAGHFPWLEQPEVFFGGIRAFVSSLKKGGE